MFNTDSISRKLTWMNLLVSAAALVLACAAFVAYDQVTYRQAIVRNLSTQAQIIGANSVSAVTFNDAQSARSTLGALGTNPNIRSAGIVTPDGRMFAEYSRTGAEQMVKIPTLAPGENETHVFSGGEIVLVRSILLQDQPIGAVYIRASLRQLTDRLTRYSMIASVVLLLSLLTALLISSRFRRSVAEPIVRLSETARQVSRDRNYSIRAASTGDRSELATLVEAFNDMLAQIQVRDHALQTARDELERRVDQRTRQLMVANRELETFSYTVSHDLRAPLEVINGFSHMLMTEYSGKLDATGREYLEQVMQATRRMAELIEDLLNLSRVTTVSMHRENVDISTLVSRIAYEIKRSDPQRNVEFIVGHCNPVQADARLLRILLENLLRNSWKYTSGHERARIEFGCVEHGPGLAFFIRDDGAGFDPASAAQLFKPFQRLHASSQFPGTGVGLATVQRIVQRHCGEVWAEGAVERGAAFYFTLPPAAAESEFSRSIGMSEGR
ncbi:MAG: ATP-binding protein [Terriglobales bacterium]